jgi:hypothetical protein
MILDGLLPSRKQSAKRFSISVFKALPGPVQLCWLVSGVVHKLRLPGSLRPSMLIVID